MNKATKVVCIIGVMVLVLGFYFYLLGSRGVSLIQTGGPVSIGLGIGVILLPIIGIWIVWATLKAGFDHQHLARRIHDEDLELDVSEMPKMPSGRISREAADTMFEQVKGEWEKDPDNWRSSYRLARAYDYAGDRGRARETMKRAVALERDESAS
ncbi:tetratricopeptide repeat protein [Rhodococcus sp. G-MC3]|uniref:tetratricopeptide repeat protein n=1 Tax=Rhodococcus sp. G-MC3 TaxID=3046209 RepID=UPI0024BB4CA9|nr:tetratricopeptide repeat protein [Rhodococcus sp. G-MC3]MDJ0391808.1 tetratricopeptide repeat protein [Rhodococcus sp. G-MC3]